MYGKTKIKYRLCSDPTRRREREREREREDGYCRDFMVNVEEDIREMVTEN